MRTTHTFARQVEPEWIDQLPADDPRALRSRRELHRINSWMMQPAIMARVLRRHHPEGPPRTMLDLGAGDGLFALQLARRLSHRWPNVTMTLHDRDDIVTGDTHEAMAHRGWLVKRAPADVFDFLKTAQPYDVVITNLFLHHFKPEDLSRLLAGVARIARTFVALEPRRSALTREMSRLLWLIGCTELTIRDAVTSSRAGFRDQELSAAWPREPGWVLHEHAAGLFGHCFVAKRTL